MARNIVVFSDGTGQDGNVRPEQRLSNIYKLYRAARIGPDSPIDPAEQVAYYDPGLGTDADAHGGTKMRRFFGKLLASIAGRGIAVNIADCYEFIINHWRPGDRIFLFGFSRGAYTVRCVAQVLALCGVPTHASNQPNLPFRRFGRSTRLVAMRAVRRVYEHGAGHPRGLYEAEREELGRRFRIEFGSNVDDGPNAAPHFIGVFDTVAALGASGWKRIGIIALLAIIAVLALAPVAGIGSWLLGYSFFLLLPAIGLAAGLFVWWRMRRAALRWIDDFPEAGAKRRTHRIAWRAKDYDRGLSGWVEYARQAAAIDETRADFPRVPWGRNSVIRAKVGDEPEPLVQLFFAGNHSDVGGSYPEPESRLSDVALKWMLEEALSIPGPLIVDPAKLHVFPDPAGLQHSEPEDVRERKTYWIPDWAPEAMKGWVEKPRIAEGFPIHPSVHARFAAVEVEQCGYLRPYRPPSLARDFRFAAYYGESDPNAAEIIAAHATATYRTDDDENFEFVAGAIPPWLAALLERAGVRRAAGILPGAAIADAETTYYDQLALRMLGEEAGKRGFAIRPLARLQTNSSHDSPGLLILGLEEPEAVLLARSFGARTLVIISDDGEIAIPVVTI